MNRRDIFWRPWDGAGLEQLTLLERSDGYIADSFNLFIEHGQPAQLWYRVELDREWRVRSLRLYRTRAVTEIADLRFDLHGPSVVLIADGAGNWTSRRGQPEPALQGCIDIDISSTPFTNTLPIRRLNLEPGESAEVPLVYINAPDLEISRVEQRYTRLEQRDPGDTYLFESLDSGFTAEIPVDSDGLVRDYPGLFHRLWP